MAAHRVFEWFGMLTTSSQGGHFVVFYGGMIYYVTLDPERAMGLAEIGVGHTIICPYKSELTQTLKRDGTSVVVLEERASAKELEKIVERGTYGILRSDRVKAIIQNAHDRGHSVYVMVLKNSQLIEDFCKKQGWKLLAPKAKVAEQFENKISQYRLLKGVAPYPQTTITSLVNLPGTVPGKSTGDSPRQIKAVLQFNRGHSGNTTHFIKFRKDLEKLAEKFPKREAKISEYIEGRTYTLNCLALKNGGIITGSISEQITGLAAATNNPNTTCGNDFTSPRKLKPAQIRKIREIAKNVGRTLYQASYRGLYGIDAIIENKSGRVFFIEVNTHQPASVSFEAKLHRRIGKTPLVAYFTKDSLSNGINPAKRDLPPMILPIPSKQTIYRNKTGEILSQKYIEKRYKGKGLVSRMKLVKPNEEIYRVQKFT